MLKPRPFVLTVQLTECKALGKTGRKTDFGSKTEENLPGLVLNLRSSNATEPIDNLLGLDSAKSAIPEKLQRANKIQPCRHLLLRLSRLLSANIFDDRKEILENDKPKSHKENPSRECVGYNGCVIQSRALFQNAFDRQTIDLHCNGNQSEAQQGRKIASAVCCSHCETHNSCRKTVFEPTNPIPSIRNHRSLVARSESIRCVEKVCDDRNHKKRHESSLHIETGYIFQNEGLINVAFGIKGISRFCGRHTFAKKFQLSFGLCQCKDDNDSDECHEMSPECKPITNNQVFHLFIFNMHTCTVWFQKISLLFQQAHTDHRFHLFLLWRRLSKDSHRFRRVTFCKFFQATSIGQQMLGFLNRCFKEIVNLGFPLSRTIQTFNRFLKTFQLVGLADLDRTFGILDKRRMFASLLQRDLVESHAQLRTLGIDNQDRHSSALFGTVGVAPFLHSTPCLNVGNIFRSIGSF